MSFRTLPAPNDKLSPVSAAFFGDVGVVGAQHGLVRGAVRLGQQLEALWPDFLCGLGDYLYFDDDPRYLTQDNTIDAFLTQYASPFSKSAFYPITGLFICSPDVIVCMTVGFRA